MNEDTILSYCRTTENQEREGDTRVFKILIHNPMTFAINGLLIHRMQRF